MEIVFSEHAVSRMFELKITPGLIQEILSNPDGKIRQSKDKWIYYKQIRKRNDNSIAVVVVERDERRFEVITVMINFEVLS
ncbi:MAG: DUF4258 domain-containing protein [Oligoflexales bacterium]|nr:DUF4258 domain-containing protein [Oligoflexales bacterium]